MSVAPLLTNNLDNSKQKTSNLLSPAQPPYSWSLLGIVEGPAPPPSSKISRSFDLAWNPGPAYKFNTLDNWGHKTPTQSKKKKKKKKKRGKKKEKKKERIKDRKERLKGHGPKHVYNTLGYIYSSILCSRVHCCHMWFWASDCIQPKHPWPPFKESSCKQIF